MTINYIFCRKTCNLARVLEWPRLRISDDTSEYVTVYLIFTYLKPYQYHCIFWSWLTKAICTFVHEDRTRSVISTANLCANWFYPGFPWMFESSCCTWFLCFNMLYTLSISFICFLCFFHFMDSVERFPRINLNVGAVLSAAAWRIIRNDSRSDQRSKFALRLPLCVWNLLRWS